MLSINELKKEAEIARQEARELARRRFDSTIESVIRQELVKYEDSTRTTIDLKYYESVYGYYNLNYIIAELIRDDLWDGIVEEFKANGIRLELKDRFGESPKLIISWD